MKRAWTIIYSAIKAAAAVATLAILTVIVLSWVTPSIFDCTIKYRSASAIDWGYVKQQLVKTLNKHYSNAYAMPIKLGSRPKAKMSGFREDELRIGGIRPKQMKNGSGDFDFAYFAFFASGDSKSLTGMVDKCGLVEVVW